MAEAALILAFIAGIAFDHFWPRIVRWAERKADVPRETPQMKGNFDQGTQFPPKYPNFERTPYPGRLTVTEAEIQPSPKPSDKRRRGVAEMRHIAERESLKPAKHQAEVTANNIKAMQ